MIFDGDIFPAISIVHEPVDREWEKDQELQVFFTFPLASFEAVFVLGMAS
jgi:hypothetical protein